MRGAKPAEVLHLRCEDAQGWQRQVEAANRLVFGETAVLCCDMHNQHREPPSELCCGSCTEATHDTFPTPHADGSRCVLDAEEGRQRHSVGELGDAKVRFWVCPVKAHRDRNDARGWPVVTVVWDGDVARCTAEGCGRTSADDREEDR